MSAIRETTKVVSGEWALRVEAESINDEPAVWFAINAGGLSGGQFLTVAQARALGAALTAHADAAEAAQQVAA